MRKSRDMALSFLIPSSQPFLSDIDEGTITGCSATTTTTKPLMKSTFCCGSRSCGSSEAGQSREKHGDTAVLFSALSVDQARRAGKEESP